MNNSNLLSQIHLELQSDDGMARARSLICKRHEWFLHASRVGNFEGIKKIGLQPRDPFCDEDDGLRVGNPDRRIICLTPVPSRISSRPTRGEQQFIVAIDNTGLPHQIGVDWSYDGFGSLIDLLREEQPERDSADIFAEVVYRYGCVAASVEIPPDRLLLWTKGSPENSPSEWPKLQDCTLNNAEIV